MSESYTCTYIMTKTCNIRPDPGSDGGVGGCSIPQRDDVFSGSDGYDHTTYLISHYELLPQDGQQLHDRLGQDM